MKVIEVKINLHISQSYNYETYCHKLILYNVMTYLLVMINVQYEKRYSTVNLNL